MILKPAAALCVGWTITLIGKKLDGFDVSGPPFLDNLVD
jgi:hypothetical protein